MDVVSDFLILILPFPILLRLQMPSTERAQFLIVFGIGLETRHTASGADSAEYQLKIDKEGLWA